MPMLLFFFAHTTIQRAYLCILAAAFIILILPEPLTRASNPNGRYGCQSNDHRACDEICKQDSFWYGHCTAWDGRDFRCECHEYRPPLDKTPCIQKQHLCSDACKAQGLEGGYCYIHTVTNAETGAADCKCFDEIPIER